MEENKSVLKLTILSSDETCIEIILDAGVVVEEKEIAKKEFPELHTLFLGFNSNYSSSIMSSISTYYRINSIKKLNGEKVDEPNSLDDSLSDGFHYVFFKNDKCCFYKLDESFKLVAKGELPNASILLIRAINQKTYNNFCGILLKRVREYYDELHKKNAEAAAKLRELALAANEKDIEERRSANATIEGIFDAVTDDSPEELKNLKFEFDKAIFEAGGAKCPTCKRNGIKIYFYKKLKEAGLLPKQ